MAYGFTAALLFEMEYVLNRPASAMIHKLDGVAESEELFDLAKILNVIQAKHNCQLSFPMQFHLQAQSDISLWPPVVLYITFSKICGHTLDYFITFSYLDHTFRISIVFCA
jgi:hypothetical protein